MEQRRRLLELSVLFYSHTEELTHWLTELRVELQSEEVAETLEGQKSILVSVQLTLEIFFRDIANVHKTRLKSLSVLRYQSKLFKTILAMLSSGGGSSLTLGAQYIK